jgi:AraC-like DNA-binding protein
MEDAGTGAQFLENQRLPTTRTRELIADGNDNLMFAMLLEGAAVGAMRDHETLVAPGQGVLMPSAEVVSFNFPVTSRSVIVGVPRRAVAAMVKDPEAAFFRPIVRTDELKLLTSYVAGVEDGVTLLNPALRHAFATHVQDLVALVIGASRDGAAIAERRGLRAARIAAIKADIALHLGEHGLTVNAVAARQGVSPRYVQMLFEAEGTTFSRFVLGRRLACAHRLLTDPRHAAWTVTAVALEAGFGDVSTFNHAFRRAYGASPSDVRAAARREDGR